ncbi:hypothetical protein RHGRI_003502 [Rhododendron griersonianum]|uniref:Secreted protein n=1 Tax=Rhododendron griersonianum TaxID=479676 RepID=A0AAV6L8D9_9ERIC|nr:hypothetical protein RHGRI_003502 [Rhododendron griersonianum]
MPFFGPALRGRWRICWILNGRWHWLRARSLVTRDVIANTAASLVPNTNCSNSVVWALHSSGSFTTKSACQAIRTKFPLGYALGDPSKCNVVFG